MQSSVTVHVVCTELCDSHVWHNTKRYALVIVQTNGYDFPLAEHFGQTFGFFLLFPIVRFTIFVMRLTNVRRPRHIVTPRIRQLAERCVAFDGCTRRSTHLFVIVSFVNRSVGNINWSFCSKCHHEMQRHVRRRASHQKHFGVSSSFGRGFGACVGYFVFCV